MTVAAFRAEQRGVAVRMLAALVATAIGWARRAVRSAAPLAARLDAAAWAGTAALTWLAAAIGNVARKRFFSERDSAGAASPPSEPVVLARSVLENTLEQVALAVPTYLLLALVEPRAAAAIAVMGACFSIGRALFWSGYALGRSARALGFALSFYPSVGGLLWLAAALVGVL